MYFGVHRFCVFLICKWQRSHNSSAQTTYIKKKARREENIWIWREVGLEEDEYLCLSCRLVLSRFPLVCEKLEGLKNTFRIKRIYPTPHSEATECVCVCVSPLFAKVNCSGAPPGPSNGLRSPTRLSRFIFKSPLIHKLGICSRLPTQTLCS